MEVPKMANTISNSNTPPAQLVEVAAIASRYKGQQDQLMRVLLECQKVVNTFSEDVAAIIAREMGLSQTFMPCSPPNLEVNTSSVCAKAHLATFAAPEKW